VTTSTCPEPDCTVDVPDSDAVRRHLADQHGKHQRARIRIDLESIASFLDLPDGIRPIFAYAESDPSAITVVVEGPELTPVWKGTESPYLAGHTSALTAIDDDGQRWHRFAWQSDAART
jgi:hypothetical protein